MTGIQAVAIVMSVVFLIGVLPLAARTTMEMLHPSAPVAPPAPREHPDDGIVTYEQVAQTLRPELRADIERKRRPDPPRPAPRLEPCEGYMAGCNCRACLRIDAEWGLVR